MHPGCARPIAAPVLPIVGFHVDNVPFSYEDIEHLADKLSGAGLDDQERLLLVAIFAAAAARARPAEPFKATLPSFAVSDKPGSEYGVENVPLKELKHQLLNAFIPGQDFTWVTIERKQDKVVIQPRFPPHK